MVLGVVRGTSLGQRKMWTINVIGNRIRGSLSMDLRTAGFVEFFLDKKELKIRSTDIMLIYLHIYNLI